MPVVRYLCRTLPVLAAIVPCALSQAALAQTSSGSITACVAKVTGITRIVASSAACVPRLETSVQFNVQGPAGPTGPAGATGPAGPAGVQGPVGNPTPLARTLFVPAGGTPQENGARLAQAIGVASVDASDQNPYLLQLDSGFYTDGRPNSGGYTIPPGISIRGEGITSTFVSGGGVSLLFQATGARSQTSSFSVSDLTAGTAGGFSLAAINIQMVTLHNVHLLGTMELDATAPGASVFISDSIFDVPIGIYDNSRDATDRFRIVGSQLPPTTTRVPGTLGCFASFTADLVPLTNTCALGVVSQ